MNVICPGTILTDSTGRLFDENPGLRERFDAAYPRGQIGKPEEIAATAAFLLSDDAAFMNGAVLTVDGGITVGVPSFELADIIADKDDGGSRVA